MCDPQGVQLVEYVHPFSVSLSVSCDRIGFTREPLTNRFRLSQIYPLNLAPSPQGQMRVFLPSQVMRMHSSCFLRCPGLVKNGLRDDLRSLFVLEICYIKTGLEVYLTLCNDDFFHEGELNSVDHRVVKTWHPRSSK